MQENDSNTTNILPEGFSSALIEAIRIGAEAGVKAAFEERDKPLLTGREAAKLIGIGKTKWYQMNSCGQIPAPTNSSKPYLWSRKEVLLWIEHKCPNRHKWEEIRKSFDNSTGRK